MISFFFITELHMLKCGIFPYDYRDKICVNTTLSNRYKSLEDQRSLINIQIKNL